MKPQLRHSDRCRQLHDHLDSRKWCIGNGACGFKDCACDALRTSWKLEHEKCVQRYNARFRDLGIRLSNDGRSRAAG
jgi:hypothetical protein